MLQLSIIYSPNTNLWVMNAKWVWTAGRWWAMGICSGGKGSGWPSAAANSWAWGSPFSPQGLQSQSGQLYLGGGGCLEGPIYRWARPGEDAAQWGLLIAVWDEWIALLGLFLLLTWQKLPSGEMPKIFPVTCLWLASIFFFFLLAFRFMLRLTMLEDSFKCVQSSA